MKKLIILVFVLFVWISQAFVDKYQNGKQQKPTQQPKTQRTYQTIDQIREKTIRDYLGNVEITQLSTPYMHNLTNPELGLDKGDLVELISVIYLDAGQQKTAVFTFNSTRLLAVKK